MYWHMLPLQIISLTVRDTSFRSPSSACLYSKRHLEVIGFELTLAPRWMGCCSTLGFTAEGCCATAAPKTPSSNDIASTHKVHRNIIKVNCVLRETEPAHRLRDMDLPSLRLTEQTKVQYRVKLQQLLSDRQFLIQDNTIIALKVFS